VVVIVEAFAKSPEGNEEVFSSLNVLTVRPTTPHMSCTINKPCTVQAGYVSPQNGHIKGRHRTLLPEDAGNHHRDDHVEEDIQWQVKPGQSDECD
jgi:hypothetical protein